MIRVMLVDDHPVVRQGLHGMLASVADIAVVGEAADGASALEQVALLKPDVILMDIRMMGLDGIQTTQKMVALNPDAKIIILTAHDDQEYLLRAFEAGAHGYLLKNIARNDLVASVRAVHHGERTLSPALMSKALTGLSDLARQQRKHQGISLTEHEVQILRLIAQGATNKEIAEAQFWSETTVKRRISTILDKLGAASRSEAVAAAARLGLLE
jgi:DNA-binding NarL/FixJ family response regulator